MPKADLVLEGGGVRGLGSAGAVIRLLDEGYTFPRAAGTSVGAIAAAFVAAGMDGKQLRSVMDRLDLSMIPDRMRPGVPLLSEGLSLLGARGAYKGSGSASGWRRSSPNSVSPPSPTCGATIRRPTVRWRTTRSTSWW